MSRAAALCSVLFLLAACAAEIPVEPPRSRRGDLPLLLVESGEIAAARSITLNAPLEWGGDLQIVELAEEGATVATGDTLVRFDTGFLEEEMAEAREQLVAKEAQRKGLVATQSSKEQELRNARTTARLSVEQASLQLEKMRYESDVKQAEARLQRRQAELALQESEAKIAAQAVLDSLDRAKVDVELADLRARLDGMQRRIDDLTLIAPAPGLLLHAEQRGSQQGARVRVGDKVRPRAPVVEIPDLSAMEVVFPVHEMDRGKVETGLPVEIFLEAAPERRFAGRVVSIARLATPRVEGGRVKVFEVRARLEGVDPLLRPGMTAVVEVELERLEDVVLVPLNCLFEMEGEPRVRPAGADPLPVRILGRGPLLAAVEGLAPDRALSPEPPAGAHSLGWARWREEMQP